MLILDKKKKVDSKEITPKNENQKTSPRGLAELDTSARKASGLGLAGLAGLDTIAMRAFLFVVRGCGIFHIFTRYGNRLDL